jgi:septal ring factor EnvC (AmiA/AmiB activator)
MVLDDLHRTELQARQAQIDESASRAAAEQTAQELQALLAQRDELADEREHLLQMLAQEIRQPLQRAGQAHADRRAGAARPARRARRPLGAQLMQAQAVLGDVRSVLDNTLAAANAAGRAAVPLVHAGRGTGLPGRADAG